MRNLGVQTGAAFTLARKLILGERGSNVSDQPAKFQPATPRNPKAGRENRIRLDDLLPKRDVKAGRRTVFGAKPKDQQQNKPST
jgi:hypothetical protein